MKFRIKKYSKGYVVEIQTKQSYVFFTKTYWNHFISVSGIKENPWCFKTYDSAMKEMLLKIECDTIVNSRQ